MPNGKVYWLPLLGAIRVVGKGMRLFVPRHLLPSPDKPLRTVRPPLNKGFDNLQGIPGGQKVRRQTEDIRAVMFPGKPR